ncbi:hypothetical protein KI688_004011 [Linnemannia hyalina]|uniref:DASH complex subunit DAD3 n=1 Tax=Linnemannia hyalina TaxID=64524 RepID=A0A9P8BSH0_9FUNG|nr:hypothetical protein KI688_004011 [Linnemannia hyalina]
MSSKELLAEYAKLAAKLEHINETLQEMNAVDIAQLIDKIRVVERKMSLVYTLFKQSVYSITMQNAQHDQDLHNFQSQDPDTKLNTEIDEQQQQYQNITPQLQQSQSQDHRRYSQEQQQYQPQSQQSDYDSSPPQSQTQQPLRSSLRTSNNENGNNSNQQPTSILRNSTYRPTTGTTTATTGTGTSRMSNAREEYQAATGNKSILALSRGQEGRSRWGNHYGYHSGSAGGGGGGSGGFDSENHTNRPRYH